MALSFCSAGRGRAGSCRTRGGQLIKPHGMGRGPQSPLNTRRGVYCFKCIALPLLSARRMAQPWAGFTKQETVTGLFSKDCILPCPFPPGDDEVIYWKKGDKNVHRYYYQRDQLEIQDPDYRNRTHLFHENIPGGNASLKLHNLTLTDEGTYSCYVGTHQNKTEVEVTLSVRDQLSNVEGSNTTIPCEYSNNTANTEGFSVVWTLNRNAVVSVLASFNGTSHSYQPRVQINEYDFSLVVHDLTANDSGEYLCNVSVPHYTKLTVTTLQVENSGRTGELVSGVITTAVVLLVAGFCLVVCIKKYKGNLLSTLTCSKKSISAQIDATEHDSFLEAEAKTTTKAK
ncbi:PREDICTED: HERV-H LTR-associating protein 2 [Charadrius vociferus]|uniref:HERV-H LTR-associating protein 2 n=1 Tax=Charadrius vociferus TaxID=50402 RepID=UPI0005218DE6|nr:PREDICTED: HERV-H LTR-associating protein 2 [Charadrius vociferus]